MPSYVNTNSAASVGINALPAARSHLFKCYIKQPLDFILALFLLIAASPLLGILAVLIRITMGSPILFRQPRPGLNEKIFMLCKYRTMTDERDQNGNLLPDDRRLTQFGKFLRSTSMDELPELINILRGDMSFIGPRPLLIKDMVFMTADQRRRHSVLPGLSGLAQVNGRNCVLWENKLMYDLQYIDNITLLGDLKILARTFGIVFRRHGVSSEGMATTEDFGDYLLRAGKIDGQIYSEKLEATSLYRRVQS